MWRMRVEEGERPSCCRCPAETVSASNRALRADSALRLLWQHGRRAALFTTLYPFRTLLRLRSASTTEIANGWLVAALTRLHSSRRSRTWESSRSVNVVSSGTLFSVDSAEAPPSGAGFGARTNVADPVARFSGSSPGAPRHSILVSLPSGRDESAVRLRGKQATPERLLLKPVCEAKKDLATCFAERCCPLSRAATTPC